MQPDTPLDRFASWAPACAEYFRDFAEGRYDERSELWFILQREDTYIDPERGAFVIGAAGCDGIEFCFREGLDGVWAYLPIEDEWVLKAGTLAELERGWLTGAISV